MKLILLLSLAGLTYGQIAPECLQGEFMADGYTTGQNIELDYGATEMSTDTSGTTFISVGFLVPKVYTEQHDASAYQITFNRNHDVTNGLVIDTTVGTATNNDAACFSNRHTYTNDTSGCLEELNPSVWTNNGPMGDSQCVDQTVMKIGWTEAMTGTGNGDGAFGSTAITDDGTVTRVYVTATVETWRKFHQTTTIASGYLGQMNGNVQLNTGGSATGRVGTHGTSGTHWGDGGDLEVEFGPLEMNDWRYTLYQIPFYIVFPKTVIVQTSFQIGTKVAVLNGIVEQDVITVNFNPSDSLADNFAVLDVTVRTEIPYPYAIRTPHDAESPMLAYIGGNADNNPGVGDTGGAAHAATIEFVSFDDPGKCGGNLPGAQCSQDWKMRIVPAQATPCSVAGDYYLEFWAECVHKDELSVRGGPNGCTLDVETTDPLLAKKRTSNGYFDLVFTVAHQSFCPEVMDSVHVAVDLQAYHDEGFSRHISNGYNNNPVDYTANEDIVYSNDIIYYEATYRTATDKSGETVANNEIDANNDVTGDGGDTTIDYVRAIKIFVDLYLGKSSQGNAVNGWDGTDWKANLNWQLGGTRIPGPGEDFDDSAVTVTNKRVLQVPTTQPADFATWKMIMCEVAYIDPEVPIMTGAKPADCFTAETDIAHLYFDFDKVMLAKAPVAGEPANTIDENEIAFKMRLDERVLPVGPLTDNSHIVVTVESEVYYKGNQHPTRRLLQAGAAPQGPRKMTSSKSLQHRVYYKSTQLKQCTVDDTMAKAQLDLTFDYKGNTAPVDAMTANKMALDLKMKMESHLSVQNAITVSKVEKCDKTGCTLYLDAVKPSTRRAQKDTGSEFVHVTLDITSTQHSDAGKIANILQSEIVQKNFVYDAEITKMTSPDCSTTTHNSKLASSASALTTLAAFAVALWNLL